MNTPPLPAGFPGMPPLNTPAGFQLPPGAQVKIEHPLPPFDVAIQEKLDAARRSGKFFIAVVIADPTPDDPSRLLCFQSRSMGFSRDWLLRGWQQICNAIVSSGLNPFPQAVQPPTPAAAPVDSGSVSAATPQD